MSDDAIGFRGFANEAEAMAAAWMAYRALARQLARRDGTRLVPIDVEPLTLAREGQHEAILASGRPIAALVRPGDDSRSGPDSFGFEIHVPAPRDDTRMHATAFLLYRTLRRSGIRWAMWQADERGDAQPQRRDTSATAHVSHSQRAARDRNLAGSSRAGGRAGEASRSRASAAGRRHLAGVSAVLAVAVVALLLPLLTTAMVVAALGGAAAIIALVALAAIVHLVATDIRRDGQRALGRGAWRRLGPETQPDAAPTSVAPLGGDLAVSRATRRDR